MQRTKITINKQEGLGRKILMEKFSVHWYIIASIDQLLLVIISNENQGRHNDEYVHLAASLQSGDSGDYWVLGMVIILHWFVCLLLLTWCYTGLSSFPWNCDPIVNGG